MPHVHLLDTLTWGATAVAAVTFLMLPLVNRTPLRAVLIVAVSVACALWHIRLRPVVRSPVEHVAWSFSLLSAGWALAVVAVGSLRRTRLAADFAVVQLARLAAVLYGVVAAVILAVLLAMRFAYALAELINGGPGVARLDQVFTSDGLWSLACLFVGCAVSLVATRDARLGVCTFLLGVMGFTWAGLLGADFVSNGMGGYSRTGAMLWLLVTQAVWLFLTTWISNRIDRRGLRGANDIRGGMDQFAASPETASLAPRAALRTCCDGLSVVLAVAICYYVIVPYRVPVGGYRMSGVACLVAAALVSAACLNWLRRAWSLLTAEVGLGHLSLAICSAATLVSLREDAPLRDQYPAIFSAIMIGFCFAAGACALIALKGYAERVRSDGDGGLVARLASIARRFAFVNAALAFLVGVVMMVWPRLPTVATMDDSLGRVIVGLAANLSLLLVVLWCARRLRQPAFHVMTVLAALLTGGFLLVRMLPFSSHVG